MCRPHVRWNAGDDAEGHPAVQRVGHIVVAGTDEIFPETWPLRDDAAYVFGALQ
jgi:hypothetical protein